MQGGVNYNGNSILSGGINVNTTGNIQALNVQVTENGERTITPPEGVDGYAPITIDTSVPIPTPVLETLNATENITYTPPVGVDGYNEVNVNVPIPTPVLETLNATENITYTPPVGVDGYDEVNVNVPIPDPVIESKSITENGTYTAPSGVDGYSPITVNVYGYTIKTLAGTPTSIASFSDGTDNPLKSLTASIEPVQSGEGDPSPSNVRPISGWDECNVTRAGINLFDPISIIKGSYNSGTNTWENINGIQDRAFSFNFKPNTQYTFSGIETQSEENKNARLVIRYTDGTSENIFADSTTTPTAFTKTSASGKSINFIYYGYGYSSANGVSIKNFQIELGSTATTYEPYAGTTNTIPFNTTVYGGEINVIDGVVTPCPYYASYNGEELEGEWISDRDVYSPNTTPTTGAQVVNIGATGTPISVQPTSIKSLDGDNNIWASTGDVEDLKYFADL